MKIYHLVNGEYKEDKDYNGYYESLKLQKQLAKKYHLGKLPINVYDLNDIIKYINETVNFVKKELVRLGNEFNN